MKNLTVELQNKLNTASNTNNIVITPPGKFEVGSLFIPSNVHLYLSEDTTLYGSMKIEDYPEKDTRVAGIEMKWPAAVLNIIEESNVTISGKGIINGCGSVWWEKFWGEDERSGMMKEYSKNGLRWAVDYDCKRPRNILIYKSKNVTIQEISSVQSGFWNLQLTFSKNILVDGITINNSKGPSTDGIDIDSCSDVTIQNSFVECNDDNICVKSGRGKEAYDKQTKCSNIVIQNCNLGKGSGVTIGSEVSGGVENVVIKNINFDSTSVGFRIKSANNRGGFIRDIKVSNLQMKNVCFPFLIQTDWNSEYSYARVPNNYNGKIPKYWEKLQQGVTDNLGKTKVSDINITNVSAISNCEKRSRAFFIEGDKDQLIKNLKMEHINIDATEFGKISGVTKLELIDVVVTAKEKTIDKNDVYER